jgi:Uma2 family endonuclease
MITFISRTEEKEVLVPAWVRDIESFRRWTDQDDFPKEGRIWWLKGGVWINMSKEDIFTHLVVKNEYAYVLTGLAMTERLGLFIPDGLLLSNFAGDISGNPDGTFILNATLHSDRVRLIEGKRGGYVELQGTPDMTLEVVSWSSVKKDLELLRQAYWDAGITEYWLVDARAERLKFDILRHTARGYVATPKRGGWIKSAVFGRSFRLTRRIGPLGHPEYKLEMRNP